MDLSIVCSRSLEEKFPVEILCFPGSLGKGERSFPGSVMFQTALPPEHLINKLILILSVEETMRRRQGEMSTHFTWETGRNKKQ